MLQPAGDLRILVVDDHPLVRAGLARTLEESSAGWRVLEAANGHEALHALRRERIDLVVTDLSMPGMTGLDLIRRMRGECLQARVLVLSMHEEREYARRAFRAGASGYLTKDAAPTELVYAVQALAAGRLYVAPQFDRAVAQALSAPFGAPAHAKLSDRQLEVLRRLVAGQRPGRIARELNLSIKTVSTHKTHIFEKLEVGSMAELVRYAITHDLDGNASLAADATARGEGPAPSLAAP